MISIEGFWIWDSWYVLHEGRHHAFYLKAPRSLGNPDLRHANATIGHSFSADLVNWTQLPDAIAPGEEGSFDDLAIWTGSIVRREGLWHLFFTGVDRAGHTSVQRIGHASSPDLITWHRVDSSPVVSADNRWYSTAAEAPAFDEPWRDPWVFFDASDGLWHMLVTAREPASPGHEAAGSVGHCTSPDLMNWEVCAPLSEGSGFTQVEVIQVLEVSGEHVIVFCAAASDVLNPGVEAATGTYSAPADGPLGPFHFDRAEPIHAPGIYAGRIVETSDGQRVLLGFIDADVDGSGFAGSICDPVPLHLTGRGTLQPAPASRENPRLSA
jgi:beta-fructofuranosidase